MMFYVSIQLGQNVVQAGSKMGVVVPACHKEVPQAGTAFPHLALVLLDSRPLMVAQDALVKFMGIVLLLIWHNYTTRSK